MPIETIQPIAATKPHKTPPILQNTGDGIAGKTVGNLVGFKIGKVGLSPGTDSPQKQKD